MNLPELLKISEILKDEGKSTEAFEFERYLASNCKTEFLRIFAFFFGNHPSELRLPFSENAEEMISNLIVFSQLKTKALEIPIDMPRGLAMPLAINEIARALDKAEQMIIGYRKVESEYPQYSQFNVSFWELYVTKRVLLFLNLKMPELFERAIVEFGRFRKKELNLI